MFPRQYMPRMTMINWIVRERFYEGPSELVLWGFQDEPTEEIRQSQTAYRPKVEALSDGDLTKLYLDRAQARYTMMEAEHEAEQADLVYNLPGVFADYGFWARYPVWTLEQTVALSLGRDPKVISSTTLKNWGYAGTPFAREYRARLEILDMMVAVSQLEEFVAPGEALALLDRLQIDYAPELLEALTIFGVQVADWHSHYEDAIRERDECRENAARWRGAYMELERVSLARAAEQRSVAEGLEDELEAKNHQVQQLIQAQTGTSDKPLDPKERGTLYKILSAVAQLKYGFNPLAAKNAAILNIVQTVEKLGHSVSEDAVRRHVRAAAEQFPREADNENR
jgi:hypothetical protein